ncbi:hypothetical protein VKS41_006731 [Umbelopsis sp. WA50703]
MNSHAALDYSLLSPNLSDILSDDQILKFYQSVKEIKSQQSPTKTAAMFFALCHAMNQQTTFLKIPNLNRLLFRQDEKCYAVDVAGTGQESVDALTEYCVDVMRYEHSASNALLQDAIGLTPRLASSENASPRSESSVGGRAQSTTAAAAKREASAAISAPPSKKSKPSLKDKSYEERKANILNELLRIEDGDLKSMATVVGKSIKQVMRGQIPDTDKDLDAAARFTKYANTSAHMETDFAPRNAGVYYNYEYHQLNISYREYEKVAATRLRPEAASDARAVTMQCRADLERYVKTTNWEAIRRRLTIGERITALTKILGPGFLLLSKHVSGRKLLHTFNAVEWARFIGDLALPEHSEDVKALKWKLGPGNIF